MANFIFKKADIYSQTPPPYKSVLIGAHTDGALYKMDYLGNVSPVTIGATGITGVTGGVGSTGSVGTNVGSVLDYQYKESWHSSSCYYGGTLDIQNTYGATSFGPYLWMYEHVITATQTVSGITSYFPSLGGCRFFIYDSGTTSTSGRSAPVNLLYDSGQVSKDFIYYAGASIDTVFGFTLSLSPGFYFVGSVCGTGGNGIYGCYARNIRSSLGFPSLISNPYIGYGLGSSLGGSSSCVNWYNNGLPSIISGSVSLSTGFLIGGTPPPMYLKYS
jgi:hypothetical protein